jgi:hypothetical protein
MDFLKEETALKIYSERENKLLLLYLELSYILEVFFLYDDIKNIGI